MFKRRLAGISAIAAACALVLLSIALPAVSARAVVSATTATLTVHKYTAPAGNEGNGLLLRSVPPANKPVSGVEYTVYKINNIDMNTNAGWQQAAQLQKKFQANPALSTIGADHYTKVASHETNASGEANFQFGAQRGLYVVVESNVSHAKVDGKPVTVVGSKPFIVAVPMTNPEDTSQWNWNVNVYPKNAVASASKKVVDVDSFTVGSQVTFPVTTDIPDTTGAPLDKYVVVDKFDTQHLTYGSVKVTTVDGSTTFTMNDYDVENSNGLVKVRFTSAGLKRLESLRGKQLLTTFTATVQSVGNSNGQFTNTAYLVPSNSYSEDPNTPPEGTTTTGGGKLLPPIPSNPVSEHYVKIVITKQSTDGTPLAGAEFSLGICKPNTQPNILSIHDTSTFTTDSHGQATIDGIRQADFYNGQKQSSVTPYCLIETKAPSGYELLPKPIQLQVTSDNVKSGIFAITVKNTKHNAGFHLPLTGSNAAIVLIAAGVLLLVGGTFVIVRKRQRR